MAQHEHRRRLVDTAVAASDGVSFRSVNYPAHYLRARSDGTVVLAESDGTGAFAAGATFHRTAGLADAAWTSFRSHSAPGSYLRHSGYVLRVDPLSSSSPALDRADATFQVGF